MFLSTWLGTQVISACSSYLWPTHRSSHPDVVLFCLRCSWNECVMTAQLEDGCVVRSAIFCALLLFTRVFLSAAANNMTDSNSGRPPGAKRLAQSPQLTDIGASPQSVLAVQANNLLFANYKSITNMEVSVTPSPAQLLSITNSDEACCINLGRVSIMFPTEEIKI